MEGSFAILSQKVVVFFIKKLNFDAKHGVFGHFLTRGLKQNKKNYMRLEVLFFGFFHDRNCEIVVKIRPKFLMFDPFGHT